MKIRYYENDEEMSFEATPKLLTTTLRNELTQLDRLNRKLLKEVTNISADEILQLRESIRTGRPSDDAQSINDAVISEVTAKFMTGLTAEQTTDTEQVDLQTKIWANTDRIHRDLFRVIVNPKKLSEDLISKIFDDTDESQFWQNVAWSDVIQFNTEFKGLGH